MMYNYGLDHKELCGQFSVLIAKMDLKLENDDLVSKISQEKVV